MTAKKEGIRLPFFSSNERENQPGLITSIEVKDGRVYFIDREWRLWTRPLHLPSDLDNAAVNLRQGDLEKGLRLILDPARPACQTLLAKLKQPGDKDDEDTIPLSFVMATAGISGKNGQLMNCKVWRMPILVPELC